MRNDNGYTLLGLAVKRGDYLISEYLLSLGADANTTNNVSVNLPTVLASLYLEFKYRFDR